jgi:hypothetical protein
MEAAHAIVTFLTNAKARDVSVASQIDQIGNERSGRSRMEPSDGPSGREARATLPRRFGRGESRSVSLS